MLNKAIIQGRLVADPELKYTQSGTAVTSFRVACDRDFKSQDPNAQNVDFLSIVAWRKTAEFITRYFNRGSMILLEGRIQVREYTDNKGQKRYATEIVADSVNFCGKKENGQQSTQSQQNAPAQQPQEFEELSDDEGELPF